MTDEQINEVMRLSDEVSGAVGELACSTNDYLSTIGEPENTFPLNPNGASKWARLQKHDGAQAIGVVFRTGTGSVGSLVDGRVVWADWLAHPNGSKPESVNAELLEALKYARRFMNKSAHDTDYLDAAIARAESAIETPTKVSPCAGHATQQDADLRQIVGIKEAVAGIAEFFEGEYHSGITGIVDASKVRGERVEDECRPEFDHYYVTQGGGGFDGDDFHGTVYFHIGNGEYATVDY